MGMPNNPVSLYGKGADGEFYPVALDPATGQLICQLAVEPTIQIGKVSIDQTSPGTTNGVVTSPAAIATATRTDVSVAAASTLVLAANAARKPGSVIACDTTAISYFKLGTGASATDFFAAVDGKTTVPGLFNIPDGYLGAIYGYGASATGAWRVTEMA
jgi:hypothetical protein